MYNNKPVVIDLFCGAGGLSEGFRQAGYHIACGVDFDKEAGATFEKNFPESIFIREDIRNLSCEDVLLNCDLNREDIELIIGGPPCQGFSMAGKRLIDDPRNVLFKEFVRFVREIQPVCFVMENVVGLVTMAGGKFKKEVIESFEEIGYTVDVQIINCADFGIPQTRRRTIFIGNRISKEVSFPKKTHSKEGSGDLLKWISTEDAIDDLPPLGEGEGIEIMDYNMPPRTLYQKYMRGQISYEEWLKKSKGKRG